MIATALAPVSFLEEPRRIDWRLLVGAALFLVGAGGAIVGHQLTDDTRSVLVATRDLPAGARLSAGDVAVAKVRVDDAMYGAAIPAAEQGSYAGTQLVEPVHAHQLLTRAQLSARSPLGPDQVAITIPVSADTAPQRVEPGSSVEILATADKGKPESRTYVVVQRAVVLDVAYDNAVSVVNTTGAGGPGSADATGGARGKLASISLTLSPEQAIAIAAARWNAALDVVLLPPEE